MAKSEMVCLGLVYSEPCHTYALDRFMRDMGLEQWSGISRASIYNTLKRLHAQECVTVSTEKVGNMPERQVYAITEKGKERLKGELRENMLLPSTGESNFYLAMFFHFGLEADETIEILNHRLRILEANVQNLKHDYQEVRQYSVFSSMIIINSWKRHLEIEIETTQEFIDLLKQFPDFYVGRLTNMYRKMMKRDG